MVENYFSICSFTCFHWPWRSARSESISSSWVISEHASCLVHAHPFLDSPVCVEDVKALMPQHITFPSYSTQAFSMSIVFHTCYLIPQAEQVVHLPFSVVDEDVPHRHFSVLSSELGETKVNSLHQSFGEPTDRSKQTNTIPWEQDPFSSFWNQLPTPGTWSAVFKTANILERRVEQR